MILDQGSAILNLMGQIWHACGLLLYTLRTKKVFTLLNSWKKSKKDISYPVKIIWNSNFNVHVKQVRRRKNIYIVYSCMYMESREKYWWAYLQGRNGDADVENGLVDTVWERRSGPNGKSSINRYTLLCVKT